MLKNSRNELPRAFLPFFNKPSAVHSYHTRFSINSYGVPRFSTRGARKSIKYVGVRIWNYLPDSLKNHPFSRFKTYTRNFYINAY